MYIHIYIYILTYIYIYVYIHTYIHIYTHTHMMCVDRQGIAEDSISMGSNIIFGVGGLGFRV